MKFTREFKIGIVAVVAVALAIWGINYLKGINIFKSTDKYYVVYGNVKGLVENAPVFMNGFKVGNVDQIIFDRNNINRIVVRISMQEKMKLPVNTSLLLKGGNIISGTKDIDIIAGNGDGFHESGDTLLASVQMEITELIDPLKAKIESVVTAIDTVMTSLSELMDTKTRKELKTTIANLNGTLSTLRSSMQSSGTIGSTLQNFSLISENLKKSNDEITAILSNFSAVSDSLKEANLKSLILHASETFAKTSELFASINNGEGTAGQLMMNDSVYNNLNNALSSLDALLIDLREHPKRYVHISVFGRKDK